MWFIFIIFLVYGCVIIKWVWLESEMILFMVIFWFLFWMWGWNLIGWIKLLRKLWVWLCSGMSLLSGWVLSILMWVVLRKCFVWICGVSSVWMFVIVIWEDKKVGVLYFESCCYMCIEIVDVSFFMMISFDDLGFFCFLVRIVFYLFGCV